MLQQAHPCLAVPTAHRTGTLELLGWATVQVGERLQGGRTVVVPSPCLRNLVPPVFTLWPHGGSTTPGLRERTGPCGCLRGLHCQPPWLCLALVLCKAVALSQK